MQTLQKIQNSENLENHSKIESGKMRKFRIQKIPKILENRIQKF
jgi:hypothetical protein